MTHNRPAFLLAGFFAGAGLSAGSSDPNSSEDQQSMYQRCLGNVP